jgi:thioredoxin reductase/bacterioferritin-associated ferredoxin
MRVDLAIIGGGPAGLAAAAQAAAAGASVALVDENAEPGGKVLRPGNGRLAATPVERMAVKTAQSLRAGIQRHSSRIRSFFRHQAWHIENGRRLYLSAVGGMAPTVDTIQCRRLILAAGAVERVLPFPGWTLPGVFTLGGLNGWAKHGVAPGRRFVVAGSGPLLPVLVHNLIRSGARIAAIASMTPAAAPFRYALPLGATMGAARAFQAVCYLVRIASARVPVMHATVVARVNGPGRVESVDLAPIDADGRPVPGGSRRIRADGAAVGYGLMPAADLARLCGCREVFDTRRGYWRVSRNRELETSVAGVFAVGDGADIKGYRGAADEGRLAGAVAAAQLGYPPLHARCMAGLIRRIRRARRFGSVLDALSDPLPGILPSIPDDTTICRCEAVTLAAIRQAVAAGAEDIHDIKRRTRIGMGQCQGRFCGQVINELFWQSLGRTRPRAPFTPRIPAKPLPLGFM